MLQTLALDVPDGRIQTIRFVLNPDLNPDKLGHVGPAGDAWEVSREFRESRRSAQ